MTTTCKNCNQHFKGHFCNNCGQSAETHDINMHFLWHDIQHGLLHFDNGIFYTIRQLFTRPGKAVREFIDGKRVKHFKPISLVLVLAGVYGLLYHFFNINPGAVIQDSNPVKEYVSKFFEWYATHYGIVELIYLPIFSIASYLAFRKIKLNFAKHLVLNAFLIGQRIFVNICLFPLLYVFNGTKTFSKIETLETIIGIGIVFWTYSQFFTNQNKIKTFALILLTYLYVIIELIIFAIIFKVIYSTIQTH